MSARTVVMGGGISGLSVALLLARRGFEVTVLERDQAPPGDLAAIGEWHRPGAPQTRQLHTFLGLFRQHLRTHLPDVYEDLLANGAEEVSIATPAGTTPAGAEDLAVLAARRPTVEWALARALRREPGVEIHYGTSVRRAEVRDGRISGVRVRGGGVDADVLIDAAGRRSPLREDFTVLEGDEDCGVVYNTRFYRLRDGVPRPPLKRGVTTMVAGDGFGAGLFYHDNRTFAIGIGRLPDDNDLKALREAEAFDQVTALFPEFEPWLRGDVSEVLTEVVPMAGLRNTLRGLAPEAPVGYGVLGDALCTTDPAFGRGASVALHQAVLLAEAFAGEPGGLPGLVRDVTAQAQAWVRPWFDDSVQADIGRTRLWQAAVDGHRLPQGAAMPPVSLFSLMEAGEHDGHLWQAAQRVAGLLAPLDSLDTPGNRRRLQEVWASGWRPQAPSGPGRADLVEVLAASSR
ncbi:FAD-dependent oxidoreductase [Streptomyces europaeiscabiei]|uniref:NAD(P)/FAD-dependent oxidoreductase n=1 Tax=Streptomyces europaeiscabiei TaxID=146819 RepID=UPI0029A8E508|nr:FAD-dependent oxidoreductase [Streptomyces europaeiscabiei]MDX3716028.1 FAD-dependent oxidoreductase [Streptomyces europaeiscabiei]MDX3848716.1 FAD-dependent oxidoreductase [Streptomyces europaeiscabiei]